MRKKKVFLAAVAILLLGAILLSGCTKPAQKPKLSELGDDELLQYLREQGVPIIEEDPDIEFFRSTIIEMEDPDYRLPIVSSTVLIDKYKRMLAAVRAYYADEA